MSQISHRLGRKALLVLAAALMLAGCSQVSDTWDTMFQSTPKKSNLKGVRISVMSLDEDLKPDDALAATPLLLPPPYRNPDWPQPGGYASNAMYHLAAEGRFDQLWSADAGKGSDTDSRLTASPVTGGGRIYVLDSEAHIFVFSLRTGAKLWSKPLAPKNGTDWPTFWGLLGKPNTIEPAKGMGGGVAYDDGKLYATSGFGVVYAMDAATGKILWKHDMALPIINAPVVNSGRIFFSTHDNHFYALATSDGRILWDHQGITESAGILASTSAAVSGQSVIAPYTSGEVFALQVQNGNVGWSDVLSRSGKVTALSELDDIAGRPVIDRGMVFATSQSGVTAAISLGSGERQWARNIAGIETPWAAGDYVYVLSSNQQLICLARKDGKVRWIHPLPRWEDDKASTGPIIWAGPVLVSNKLVVVSTDGHAEAISPYTGKFIGRIELPGPTSVAPIVADGTMYVYTDDAQLVALR